MEPGERPLLKGVIEQQVVDRHRDGEHEMTARPRPKAVLIFLDTARNEHIPKKKARAMFSTKMV